MLALNFTLPLRCWRKLKLGAWGKSWGQKTWGQSLEKPQSPEHFTRSWCRWGPRILPRNRSQTQSCPLPLPLFQIAQPYNGRDQPKGLKEHKNPHFCSIADWYDRLAFLNCFIHGWSLSAIDLTKYSLLIMGDCPREASISVTVAGAFFFFFSTPSALLLSWLSDDSFSWKGASMSSWLSGLSGLFRILLVVNCMAPSLKTFYRIDKRCSGLNSSVINFSCQSFWCTMHSCTSFVLWLP